MNRVRTLSLLLLLPACVVEDAGDEAFVQRVIPAVLGRKARGAYEIQALTNIAADPSYGREAVVDVLMEQPEFQDYWTWVLADTLRMRRVGDLGQSADCWEQGLLDPSELEPLGIHLQDANVDEAFSSTWNLNDALRASLVVDDLSVAWRAYLPAMTWPMVSGEKSKVADQFREVFLGRDPGCIACHSSAYGETDAIGTNTWDRHATAGWDIESSLFSGPATPSFNTGNTTAADYADGEVLFQTNCISFCHGADGADVVNDKRLSTRVPVLTDEEIAAAVREGPSWMTAFETAAVSDEDLRKLTVYLRYEHGNPDGLNEYFEHKTVDADVDCGGSLLQPWGVDAACSNGLETDCEDAVGASVFAGVEGPTPDIGGLAHRLREGLETLPDELAARPAAVDAIDLPTMDGGAAYAHQVAEVIADAILAEITGARGGLAHGFSRNEDQRELRDGIIDALVVADVGEPVRLSLSSALKEGLLEDSFNAVAPADSSLSPYVFPMIFNPWAARDPGSSDPLVEGDDANSMGDVVHRYSVPSLSSSVSAALLWPEANLWPSDTWYGGGFVYDVGGYRSDAKPGRDQWDMQSLLYWEATPGLCADRDPGDTAEGADWVDLLIAQSANQRLEDVLGALRDRLLSDAAITGDERTAIETAITTAFGAAVSLDTAIVSSRVAGSANFETALRDYCGALVTSPQFTLAGLPLVTTVTLPALQICPAGETCDVATLQAELISQLP